MRRTFFVLLGVVIFAALWEGYKLVGSPDGTVVFGVRVLPRADDLSMPHLWTVFERLGKPELTGGRPVWIVILHACVFTFGITAAGFVAGALIGLLLAVLMQRFQLVERGFLPYVILSQTVPLVALAPLVAGWGGTIMPAWATVAVIASYLSFFPVAVGMLRGLQSPSASGVELMRSYAAGWWRTLVKLRFPAALPYLFPALRLAGAAAVVGAVVGEISTGTRGGIGRLVIEYSREATSDPAKVYTAMLGAALLGLFVAGVVSLLEVPLMRHRRHVEVVTL
ncbi:ABC transporter permease [Paractinoplanes ferrugineus]|uniref:ABC transporter permease n=1 Tax=Paractinoplanes ferrugineus TaxID=113564 RepID=UPI001944352F|nr:ABC transporter permease subunit [Actinoplanes ferrugineus]